MVRIAPCCVAVVMAVCAIVGLVAAIVAAGGADRLVMSACFYLEPEVTGSDRKRLKLQTAKTTNCQTNTKSPIMSFTSTTIFIS